MPKSISERPDTQITPEPALEKRTRRQLTPEYKLRIIAQADACKRGELGALLRREKIYSSQLSEWRREFAENGVAGLSKSAPGPAVSRTPEQLRIDQLEKENDRLNRKLEIANDCLDLQKNKKQCVKGISNSNVGTLVKEGVAVAAVLSLQAPGIFGSELDAP
jgi:transposase